MLWTATALLFSFFFQGLKRVRKSWRNPQRVPANDVKILIFPWAHDVWHLRSVVSFEVQANVFQVGRERFKQGAYLQNVSQPHTSVPRTVAPLHRSPGSMQRVHMCMRTLGLTSASCLDSQVFSSSSPPHVCLSLSLLQARIFPSTLTWRHAHPDRALCQPVMHYQPSAAAPPQRRRAVLWTGHDKVTFLVLCFPFPLLPSSTQHLHQSVLPETRKHFLIDANWNNVFRDDV